MSLVTIIVMWFSGARVIKIIVLESGGVGWEIAVNKGADIHWKVSICMISHTRVGCGKDSVPSGFEQPTNALTKEGIMISIIKVQKVR